MRHLAEKTDPAGNAELGGLAPQGAVERPGAGDQQHRVRQRLQRGDRQIVALAFDQMADREQHLSLERRPGQAEPLTVGGAVGRRPEQAKIDAVAQHRHPVRRGAELDQLVLQRPGHGDQPVRFRRGGDDLPAGPGKIGDQVEVGAAGGDHHRLVEGAAERHGGDPVRIEVVGVDQVEVEPAGDQPRDRPARRVIEQPGRDGHADLGQHRIARMVHREAVPGLEPGRGGIGRVLAEHRRGRRKPRHRGHHRRLDPAGGQEMAQPVFHEHPVRRPDRVRKQGRER